ncbi:hypothetical protein CBQ26_03635 [Deinococcus indicus]|uniref:Uncharacterized protein n=1 Tax=Deinococcus indicus TaxID=223556 RepID=A0A246BP14_9DEIO|nr:hypothetical protein [Deinococcus indicus]OWL97401.1 hypothetical protein CBQ26_03635 [Deinococcus indicus]GHG30630.1 hypothetical protein GCM10017784_24710 [Deinococcus indicus]
MIYERLPRPDGLQLTREQLRVYMMCNGRRALEEVAALTRLPLGELQSALKDLQQLNLLAPAATPAAPAVPLPAQLQQQLMQEAQAALNALPDDALPSAEVQAPPAAELPPVPHTLPEISAHLRGVLTEHLGGRAAPYVAQISACRDLTELGALVPKMAAKIKLVIHEQAGSALKDAFAQCLAAHAAQEAARA